MRLGHPPNARTKGTPVKVTVLTPDVANAKFPNGPQKPTCPYVVAAPDGLYAGPTFEWARQVAESYNLPVSYL